MENGLVSGYTLQSIKDGALVERLFFVDGSKIFEGVDQKVGPNFISHTWVVSNRPLEWLWDNAEFIGKYPRPSNL
jgi:hypothetical protein